MQDKNTIQMTGKGVGSEELIVSINRIICVVNRIMEPILTDKISLTFSQLRILLAISRGKNVSQSMIASYLDVTAPTVSRHIQNLQEKNLIVCSSDAKNRRKNILATTAKGEKTLRQALQLLNEAMDAILGDVSQSERKVTVENLNKIFFAIKRSQE